MGMGFRVLGEDNLEGVRVLNMDMGALGSWDWDGGIEEEGRVNT